MNHMSKRVGLFLFSLCFCVLFSCTFEKGEILQPRVAPTKRLCDSLNITYSGVVSNIIETNCNGCHGAGYSAGDFTNYAGLKLKVDNGSFKNRVFTLKNMPISGPLSAETLEKIQCWLDAGAPNN